MTCTECIAEAIGEGTSVLRFMSVPTLWLRRLICACGTLPGNYQPPARVFVLLLSTLGGAIYLWLKLNLVVKISSDIVSEYFCQVCVMLMMFAAPTADCVMTWLAGKWLRNQSTHRSTTIWPVTTWDMKNMFYIRFSHFTLTETSVLELFPVVLQLKISSILTHSE